jgi:hypothetical protein
MSLEPQQEIHFRIVFVGKKLCLNTSKCPSTLQKKTRVTYLKCMAAGEDFTIIVQFFQTRLGMLFAQKV